MADWMAAHWAALWAMTTAEQRVDKLVARWVVNLDARSVDWSADNSAATWT